jgi:prophage regulatory protein
VRTALDLPKVCDALTVSPSTLYGLIRKGEFPKPFRVGRSSRWSSDDVDAYVLRKAESREPLEARPCLSFPDEDTRRSA